jgi:hypothetical protein
MEWQRSCCANWPRLSTLMRLEVLEGVPGAQAKTLETIQKAFEEAGVEFIGSPQDGPGVRLRK